MSATPILPGFHPDPSICRVGDDYYLITSTFEYLPGVPVHHSRDLTSWTVIGHVFADRDHLSFPSSAGSAGIFAPTIRHHEGRFWVITTDINTVGDGQLLTSAATPEGPWSPPLRVSGAIGIDPDLFWDADGTCYLTWATGRADAPILQASVDLETGDLLSEPALLSTGSGLAHPEGPHLLRRGDWYYLLLAEGGTERGHAVTIARSRTATGPFVFHPGGPILSHRSSTDPVQNTGHADLVETADGWSMVYLGVRPVGPGPGFHLNGRETFLAKVSWVDDWPVVDENLDISPVSTSFTDDFSADRLDLRWIAPGRHPGDFTSVSPRGVVIDQPSDERYRSLLATRVRDQQWEARADVEPGDARLVLRMDEDHWVAVECRDGQAVARATVGPFAQDLGAIPLPATTPVTLSLRSTLPIPGPHGGVPVADDLQFGIVTDDGFVEIARMDGRYVSTEVAGGFTGRVIGVEPMPATGRPAVLRSFSYEAIAG
ncbi:family 43 glycosylhydrolase [Microbacterium sp. P26]|uniref:glycoside hydrolase family 43 protein n=1 Tax=Microbacterium TaxID=33882 RepID=UPI0027DEE4C5|nr:family 43 glycosylhydrolase [Microbacterium sp. P26]